MSYAQCFTTILLATFLAALVTGLSQRFINPEFRHRHHEVGSVVFLQLGVMFAVLLAFVFSEAWSEYDEAAKAINLEVSAMHGAAMVAATLAPGEAETVLSAEKAYLMSVVSEEWPVLVSTRQEERKTDRLLTQLVQSVANLHLSDLTDRDKKNTILSLLREAHKQREVRIYQAQNGIPIPLWCVLIGYAVVLVLFVSLSAIENMSTAVAIASCFAAGAASILIMERLLDYPFEGALRLPASDFTVVIDKIMALTNQHAG